MMLQMSHIPSVGSVIINLYIDDYLCVYYHIDNYQCEVIVNVL